MKSEWTERQKEREKRMANKKITSEDNWLTCELCGEKVMLVDIELHIQRERKEGIRE